MTTNNLTATITPVEYKLHTKKSLIASRQRHINQESEQQYRSRIKHGGAHEQFAPRVLAVDAGVEWMASV